MPVRLDCSHVFCEECILEWLERDRTCPMCRAQVRGRGRGEGGGRSRPFKTGAVKDAKGGGVEAPGPTFQHVPRRNRIAVTVLWRSCSGDAVADADAVVRRCARPACPPAPTGPRRCCPSCFNEGCAGGGRVCQPAGLAVSGGSRSGLLLIVKGYDTTHQRSKVGRSRRLQTCNTT